MPRLAKMPTLAVTVTALTYRLVAVDLSMTSSLWLLVNFIGAIWEAIESVSFVVATLHL